MKTVHKFRVEEVNTPQAVSLPTGARVLSGGAQITATGRIACLWAEVDSEVTTTESRGFIFVGTGRYLPDGATIFINTFQIGEFVFHVYEIPLR